MTIKKFGTYMATHNSLAASEDALLALNKRALRLMLLFSLVMLLLAVYCGSQHDYRYYLMQWSSLVSGGPAWTEGNFYGPLHVVIGYLVLINPLAPKIMMVSALLFANFVLFRELIEKRSLSPILLVYIISIPVNALFIGVGIVFGLNDDLVAALLMAAVLFKLSNKSSLVGLCIALAALLKLYPILLLPFFSLDRGNISWKTLITGAFIFLIGLTLSYFIWGDGLIKSFTFGSNRWPSLMSIFRDINVFYGESYVYNLLVKYNSLLVIFSVILAFFYSFFKRLSFLEGAIIGYTIMLLTYKVGHQQFYLPLLLLLAALPIIKTRSADTMLVIFIPFILYLSTFQILFDLGTNFLGYQPQWINFGGAGFITFSLTIFTMTGVFISYSNSYGRMLKKENYS
jgi:hypothetical protein